MPFAPEQEIGPYRIVSEIGRGGMGTVYKAYQASLDRYVAIKVPLAGFQANADVLARFSREVRIIAKLDHPGIIPIYDVSEFEGTPYLVMRYVEGQTLREFLVKYKKAVSLSTLAAIIRPVSSALASAHQKGVLHRDVKPSNIMLGNDGNVYLMDFGLARIAAEVDITLSKGVVIGTPYYVSPEQAKGESVDERTDIYSLGIVLFELLTGRVPFTGDTPSIVIYHHISTPPPVPSTINPQVPQGLEQVALKALAKNKNERFASASEMRQAFEDAIRTSAQPLNIATIVMTNPGIDSQVVPVPVAQPVAPPAPAPAPATGHSSRSGWLLGAALLILVCELALLVPILRSEIPATYFMAVASFLSQFDPNAVRIVIGTLVAYLATMLAQIILSRLRKRLPGIAFFFAVAFGITLVIAVSLVLVIFVLLNVFPS